MIKKSEGYLLPQTMPTGYKCLRVIYPDDPLFQAALWGSLDYLATWIAWERTEDKRGAIAAALWKDGIALTRELQGEGCSMITNIRQNDTMPCQLEISIDNGITWSPFADLNLCPTYPAPPSNVSDDISADVLHAIYQIVIEIIDTLVVGNIPDAVRAAALKSNLLLGDYALHIWQPIATLIDTYDATQIAELQNTDSWLDIQTTTVCATIDDNLPADWDDWLNHWTDQFVIWCNLQATTLATTLNQVASYITGQHVTTAAWQDNGGGSGFGWSPVVCEWVAHLDFRQSDHGFYIFGDWRGGVWTDGVGWVWQDKIQEVGAPSWRRGVSIRKDFDVSNVTRITMIYDMVRGYPVPPDVTDKPIRIYIPYGSMVSWLTYAQLVSGTQLEQTWLGNVNQGSIRLACFSDYDTVPTGLTGSAIVTDCVIYGTGPNPFD